MDSTGTKSMGDGAIHSSNRRGVVQNDGVALSLHDPDVEVGDGDVPDDGVESAIARAWYARRREELIEQQIQQHQAMWRAGMDESGSSGHLRHANYASNRAISSGVSVVSDKTDRTPIVSNRQVPSTYKVSASASAFGAASPSQHARRIAQNQNNATPRIDECSVITLDSEVERHKLCKCVSFDCTTRQGIALYGLFLIMIAGIVSVVVLLLLRDSDMESSSASVANGVFGAPSVLPMRPPTLSPIEGSSSPLQMSSPPTAANWPNTEAPTDPVRVQEITRSPVESGVPLGGGEEDLSTPYSISQTMSPAPFAGNLAGNPTAAPVTVPPTVPLTFELLQTVAGSGSNATQFGYSIALSLDGKVLAIGAPEANGVSSCCLTRAGFVEVYERDTVTWRRRSDPIEGRMENDRAGFSVALNFDGSVLAFSEPGRSDDAGGVRILEYNPSSGNYDIPRGQELSGNPSSLFGSALQISRTGTTLVASAPVTGTVVVYRYKNETSLWEQLGDTMKGSTTHDLFGSAVALFEERGIMTVAISAPKDNESRGFVQAYQFSVGIDPAWRMIGNMTNRDLSSSMGVSANALDNFGQSLSLTRAENRPFRVAVGAPLKVNPKSGLQTGMIVVYELSTSYTWSRLGEPLFSNSAGDKLGHSCKLFDEGALLLAGAPGGQNGMGFVRFYQFQGKEYVEREEARGIPVEGGGFGWSVDGTRSIFDGNATVLAVGAQQMESSKTGYVALLKEV